MYGVQAEGADAIARSFKAKRLISTDTASTIADGIAVKSPGDITVDLISRYADGVVTVSDMEISSAILLLMERCKQIVEPAGATPLAAVLSGKLDVKGKRVVCIMSGGNIDVSSVQHDKLSQGLNPNETTVSIACEVAGEEHGKAVMDALKNHGYTILMD